MKIYGSVSNEAPVEYRQKDAVRVGGRNLRFVSSDTRKEAGGKILPQGV